MYGQRKTQTVKHNRIKSKHNIPLWPINQLSQYKTAVVNICSLEYLCSKIIEVYNR